MAWRFLAYRLHGDGTETQIHPELPISNDQMTRELSGPGAISGTITPAIAELLDEKGNPVLVPWQTAIYAEEDGHIRDGWLFVKATEDEADFKLETTGWTGYPKDQPYSLDREFFQKDPIDLYRHIWDHLQAKPGGNIGLQIDTRASTPVRLGIPEDPDLTEAKHLEAVRLRQAFEAKKALQQAKDAENAARELLMQAAGRPPKGEIILSDSEPAGDKRDEANLWIDSNDSNRPYIWDGKAWTETAGVEKYTAGANKIVYYVGWYTYNHKQVDAAQKELDAAQDEYDKAKAAREKIKGGEAEPWTLRWWEDFDLGARLDELTEAGSFDYRIEHEWDGENVSHWLRIGYPRLGRRRDDLRFAVGENVTVLPQIDLDGADYANHIVVLGAGEGQKMVRGEARTTPDRLHRVKVIEDKSLKTKAKAEARARAELRLHTGTPEISEITVRDHDNAPAGSYDVGDDIFVIFDGDWNQEEGLWFRILSITTSAGTSDRVLGIIRAEKVT